MKLHFASLSTFPATRRVPSAPLFLLVKLNFFLTSEVGKDIIMTDLSIFRNIKNLMFVSLAGFYLNQARFRVRFLRRCFVVRIIEMQSVVR